jgi:predicted small secreted protein
MTQYEQSALMVLASIALAAVLVAVALCSGCNTVRGFGIDVQHTAEAWADMEHKP